MNERFFCIPQKNRSFSFPNFPTLCYNEKTTKEKSGV